MKPQPAEDLAEGSPSSMPRHCWQLDRNAGMAALFVGLSCRDFGGRLHFWRMELRGRVGRERSSSEDVRETLQVCPALSTLHMPL